jgi:hypothetical protein
MIHEMGLYQQMDARAVAEVVESHYRKQEHFGGDNKAISNRADLIWGPKR